jgi:hypothetical protein
MVAEPLPVTSEPVEFWFIWTKTGRPPRFVHDTEAGALTEAARLSRLHPGRKFIVLRAEHKLHCPAAVPAEEAA